MKLEDIDTNTFNLLLLKMAQKIDPTVTEWYSSIPTNYSDGTKYTCNICSLTHSTYVTDFLFLMKEHGLKYHLKTLPIKAFY